MEYDQLVLLILVTGYGFAALAPVLVRRRSAILLWLVPLLAAGFWAVRLSSLADSTPVPFSLRWSEAASIELAFMGDGIALLLATLISGIGGVVILYALRYLQGDARIGRFLGLMHLFMTSMLGLVLADDLLLLFVFWELTTVSSYFLIGFDSADEGARKAALQALLVTAGGGLALLAGFLILADHAGTFRISAIAAAPHGRLGAGLPASAVLLIIVGAMTKSAQFPFHFWLPAAMRAPTPVSAYLHSATMVKAGVFLLARLSPAMSGHPLWQSVLPVVGGITFAVGAVLALAQYDLKLVLADMTISALGLMTFLLGIATPLAVSAAVAYLLAHALYKGAGFLVVGIIDHQTGTRDLRKLSGLGRSLPFTASAAFLSAFSMAGVPLFLGFVGKELAYESVLAGIFPRALGGTIAVMSFAAMTASAGMLALRPFFGPGPVSAPVRDAPVAMWIGPLALGVVGLVTGAAPGALNAWMGAAVGAVLAREYAVNLSIWHGLTPALAMSMASLGLGVVFYRMWPRVSVGLGRMLTAAAPLAPGGMYGRGMSGLLAGGAWLTRRLQSGSLRSYLIVVFLGVAVPIALLVPSLELPTAGAVVFLHEWAVVLLMILASLAVLGVSSSLGAVIFMGVVGYAIAVVYVLFGAPDLAMTQFLVETLSVILLAITLVRLPAPRGSGPGLRRQVTNGAVALFCGAAFVALIWSVLTGAMDQAISEYFARNSVALGHGRNVVNVILVDFRALDTLGEIAVLAVGGLGVHALLRLRRRKGRIG